MCIESRQRLLLRHCCCHHCRIHPATIGANKMAKSCPKAVYIAFLECSADFLHIVCSVGRLVHHLKLPQVLPSYTEASIESAWSPTDSMRIKPWLCRWSTRHTMARVSKFWGSLGLPCCLYVWCVRVSAVCAHWHIARPLLQKHPTSEMRTNLCKTWVNGNALTAHAWSRRGEKMPAHSQVTFESSRLWNRSCRSPN